MRLKVGVPYLAISSSMPFTLAYGILSADEEGYVFLGVLGNLILKKQPDFDPRNYGFKKLVDLIKNLPGIEIDERPTGKKNVSHFFVRAK